MRTKFIKYGKNIRRADGTMEHLEISIEIGPNDSDEDAVKTAKSFVSRHLQAEEKPLTASLWDVASANKINRENKNG